MSSSYIQKFMFEQLPVKGSLVVLEDSWQTIATQRRYPSGLKRLLGELLAANVLLTSNIKLQGKIICQIQDNPHFNLVVCECSNEFIIRATAKFAVVEEAMVSYSQHLTQGRLVVSIESQAEGNVYQSIIAVNGDLVSDILNNYMAQSEQLKSWFIIAYSEDKVVGFMLQQLPDLQNQALNDIERIFMLAKSLTTSELLNDNLEQILYKLFNEDNLVVMPQHAIHFGCSCSRHRVSEILHNLGRAELESLIVEQGNITVDCDYCNAEYQFTAEELTQCMSLLSIEDLPAISQQLN